MKNKPDIMQQRTLTIVLGVGLFFAGTMLISAMSNWRMPDNQQGYAPEQPIAYSHRLHAGELGIDCQFCHNAASSSRHAGIPTGDVCMKCHTLITASLAATQQERELAEEEGRPEETIVSEELQKLYDSLGLDENRKPIEGVDPSPIRWVRVHDLPDYVIFSHQAHVTAGVSCQRCHGPVETMERVEQHSDLSMGWCVNCHREVTTEGLHGHSVNASTDCTVCHH